MMMDAILTRNLRLSQHIVRNESFYLQSCTIEIFKRTTNIIFPRLHEFKVKKEIGLLAIFKEQQLLEEVLNLKKGKSLITGADNNYEIIIIMKL